MRFLVLVLAACSGPDNAGFVPTQFDLPVMRITSGEPIVSRETYVRGALDGLPTQVKGHGHSSWEWPKKPYRIKLDEKADLLGMPAAKDWVLIANYADKTLIRNALAFTLSEQLHRAWTPRFRFVELFVNDAYQGVYQLTEEIRIAKNRVDIDDEGFLLEADEQASLVLDSGIAFDVKDGDPDQARTILQAAENDPLSIDRRSALTFYWVNELMKTTDGTMYRSVYLYKDVEGPLFFGPVWDFDMSSANVKYEDQLDPANYYIRNGPWFDRMFQDPAFRADSNAVRAELLAIDVLGIVDSLAAQLALGQENNFNRWPILDYRVQAEPHGSYVGEVSALKAWLGARLEWLSAQDAR